MKFIIRKILFIDSITRKVYLKWLNLPCVFNSSRTYWMKRYRLGGNSGNGSYAKLAEFKAEILNQFVSENNITSIIEYGCGDGNQLKLCHYPSYLGFDISPEAIDLCRNLFADDDTKTFKMMDEYHGETAKLTLSLDVIYHLVENYVFSKYMHRLFDSSEKFVLIYSSNTNNNSILEGAHVRHRKFTEWVKHWKPEWKLVKHIPNRYPFKGSLKNGSPADFFLYQKRNKTH